MILLSFVIGSSLAFLAFLLVCVVKAGASKEGCESCEFLREEERRKRDSVDALEQKHFSEPSDAMEKVTAAYAESYEAWKRVGELESQLESANKLNADLRGKNAALEHHSKTLDHELSRLGHRFTVTHPHGDPYREVQGQR